LNKDSYDIDEILSEVKKRKEEQAKAENKKTAENTKKVEHKTRVETEKEVETEQKAQQEPENELRFEEKPEEKQPEKEPELKIEETQQVAEPETISENADDEQEVEPKAEQEPEADEENQMVDLNELAEDDDAEPKQVVVDDEPKVDGKAKVVDEEKKRKKKKIAKIIIAVLVVLIILAGAFFAIYANGLIDEILNNSSSTYSDDGDEEPWQGMDGDVENFDPITETDASQLSSLQDMIKTWYYNGTPCSSSKVLNVLLIGEDTRGTEILDDGTRADAAIIASINSETKTITLTSVLRDTYAYFESTPNDVTTGQFGKINGAMSIGNIKAYINCVENLYKIDIDNYVIVNFDSFETIVDTLGGVELEITDKEINEINNHQKRYNNTTITKTYSGTSGTMKLNGKQALAYCRIRKLDSDNKRADRQKTCLVQLFNQANDASTSQIIKLVKQMIPYVSTGFSKSDIIKIAKYALTQDWLSYDVQTTSVPDYRINEKGSGGKYYGAWCWKSDFPMDAYYLQTIIYGKSSITLAQTRVDIIKCAETGFYSSGASPVTATLINNNYGEVTTCVITTSTTSKNEETTTSN
jgi:LCP family protein required for cell wall assembly